MTFRKVWMRMRYFLMAVLLSGSVCFGQGRGNTKPFAALVMVTFFSGDVIAPSQELSGPFTATIDFLKYIPWLCPDSPPESAAVLEFLASKNPITYDSLAISLSKRGPLYSRLDFKATIEGVSYAITMNAFLYGTIEYTPTLDTIGFSEGRFAVMFAQPGRGSKTVLITAGYPERQVTVDFTMTK